MSQHAEIMPNQAPKQIRRGVLIGAAAASSVIAWDVSSQFVFWKHTPTEVVAEELTEPPAERWLTVPGLGHNSGKFIVDELQGRLPGAIDFMNLSSRGISVRKVAAALQPYFNTYFTEETAAQPSHNAFLHSMGLLTYLRGIEWRLKNNLRVPPVKTLISLSGPLNIQHTSRENAARLFSKVPYPGGMMSKLAVEFYQRYQTERFRLASLGKSATDAFKTSYRDTSPALWSSQVRMVVDADLSPNPLFAEVFTPETHVIHLGDPEDKIVKVPDAWHALSEFLKPYGSKLTIIPMPDEGHANVPAAATYLKRLFLA